MKSVRRTMYGIIGVSEVCTRVFWRDLMCEFTATFIYIAFHTASGMQWSDRPLTMLEKGLPSGFIVFCLIEGFGHLSGAHFNPAVTLGFFFTRDIKLIKGIAYMIFQCGGAITGAFLTYWMTPPELRNRLGPIAPNPAVEWYQAFSGEVFLMFALMFIIYGATDEKLRSGVYLPSLPIGCTVGVGIIFMGPYTGGCMNPALALGPAVATDKWRLHWIYWAGSFAGTLIATVLYKWLFVRILVDKLSEEENEKYTVEKVGNINPQEITDLTTL